MTRKAADTSAAAFTLAYRPAVRNPCALQRSVTNRYQIQDFFNIAEQPFSSTIWFTETRPRLS